MAPVSYDREAVDCRLSLPLAGACALSSVAILACIDRVLQVSNQSLDRSIALATVVALVALGVYDTKSDISYLGLYGTSIGLADILAMITLVIGMELHGRDPVSDEEAVTHSALAEVKNIEMGAWS